MWVSPRYSIIKLVIDKDYYPIFRKVPERQSIFSEKFEDIAVITKLPPTLSEKRRLSSGNLIRIGQQHTTVSYLWFCGQFRRMHFIFVYRPSVPDFIHGGHGPMARHVEGPSVPPVSEPQTLHRGVIGAAGEPTWHGAALVILGVDHATTENTLTQRSLLTLA